MCLIDLETCEVWDETHRKARKEHLCSCCRRTIVIGETYLVHFSVFEGNITKGKCCRECERDRAEFAKAHEGQLCDPGFFPEMLISCVADVQGDEEEEPKRWLAMIDRIESAKT